MKSQWCAGQSLEAVDAVPQQGAKAEEGHQERAVFLGGPCLLCLAQQDLQDAPGQSMQSKERCTTAAQVSLPRPETASVNLLELGYIVESQSHFDT